MTHPTTESLLALMEAVRKYGVDSRAATKAFNAHVARLEASETKLAMAKMALRVARLPLPPYESALPQDET